MRLPKQGIPYSFLGFQWIKSISTHNCINLQLSCGGAVGQEYAWRGLQTGFKGEGRVYKKTLSYVIILKLNSPLFQVIVALLNKFKVADNPRKFALFECYQEEDNHGESTHKNYAIVIFL